MGIGAVLTYLDRDWLHVGTSLFTLVVSFAPLAFERLFRLRLPAWVHGTFVAFIFLSMFSGEVLHAYGQIWPWDDAMHMAAGVLVGLGCVLWLQVLAWRNYVRAPVWFQAFFIVCVAALVVVSWEIAEFASDQLFGTSSQDHSLTDTMLDLIEGVGGGLVMVVFYVLYRHGRRAAAWLGWIVERFEGLNR